MNYNYINNLIKKEEKIANYVEIKNKKELLTKFINMNRIDMIRSNDIRLYELLLNNINDDEELYLTVKDVVFFGTLDKLKYLVEYFQLDLTNRHIEITKLILFSHQLPLDILEYLINIGVDINNIVDEDGYNYLTRIRAALGCEATQGFLVLRTKVLALLRSIASQK